MQEQWISQLFIDFVFLFLCSSLGSFNVYVSCTKQFHEELTYYKIQTTEILLFMRQASRW